MEKKISIFDSALIKNDVLRPWTIDIEEHKKLIIENHKLDIVLAYTTPQKFAGVIGGSPLDAKPLGFQEFQQTLNQKVSRRLNSNNNNLNEIINDNNIKSTQSSSRSTNQANEARSNGNSRSNSKTISLPSTEQLYDESDLLYIDNLKRSIYKKATRIHKHVDPLKTLDAIKYSTSEPELSPYKSKLTLLPVIKNNMKSKIKMKSIQPGNKNSKI